RDQVPRLISKGRHELAVSGHQSEVDAVVVLVGCEYGEFIRGSQAAAEVAQCFVKGVVIVMTHAVDEPIALIGQVLSWSKVGNRRACYGTDGFCDVQELEPESVGHLIVFVTSEVE